MTTTKEQYNMDVSEQGVALIRRFEGCRLAPYRCPAGRPTIGYGHVVGPDEDFPACGITQAEAEALLAQDAARAAMGLARYLLIGLKQYQFDALTSFVFNVGAGAFARSTLRQVVNRGWHAEVPAQLLHWAYAGGRLQPGLLARRRAEGAMYRGDDI
jgi:lysozyme